MALVIAVPESAKLNLLTVAEAYIALSRDNPLQNRAELRLEDICDYDWILPAPHVNPFLHEMLHSVRTDRKIRPPEVHHFMTVDEASELILAHKGVAFLTRGGAWRIARDGVTMRPLAENGLRLVTKLATQADNKSRVVSEFVRAAGRKLMSTRPAQQVRLPLAG
jgi:DNA-binding transcriptional LysR family regulator